LLLTSGVAPVSLQAAPGLTIQQNVLPATPDNAQADAPAAETAVPPKRKKRTDRTDWGLYAASIGGVLLIVLFYLRTYLRKKDLEQLWGTQSKAQKIRVRAQPSDKRSAADRRASARRKADELAMKLGAQRPAHTEDSDLFDDADDGQTVAVEDHYSVLEQADIMLSYGRIEDAAGILLNYLENNPKKSADPWIKLLDIYRETGMKTKFTALAERLNKTLNVSVITWERSDDDNAARSLEDFPHIKDTLTTLWGTVKCLDYLQRLLLDNREGARTGFPLPVVGEISVLIAMLQESLGIQPQEDLAESPTAQPTMAGSQPIQSIDPEGYVAPEAVSPPALEDLEPFDLQNGSQDIAVEETDSVLAQAEIMLTYGRIEGAAAILLGFLESNPKKSVEPWMKLLDIYRLAGMKTEFAELAERFNQTLNVSIIPWERNDDEQATQSIERFEQIVEHVTNTWGTLECLNYLQHLLRDNRDGARAGFPLPVTGEIVLLIAVLQDHLGLTEII